MLWHTLSSTSQKIHTTVNSHKRILNDITHIWKAMYIVLIFGCSSYLVISALVAHYCMNNVFRLWLQTKGS